MARVRHAATTHLFLEALRTVARPALRSFRVVVFTGTARQNGATMAYCRRDGQHVSRYPIIYFGTGRRLACRTMWS